MYASFDNIEIPNVASVEPSFEDIGDIDRTAGGNLRQDIVAVKRTWRITTTPITWEKASPLIDHYRTYMGAEGDFWIYGESAPVRTKLKIENYPVTPFSSGGQWQKNAVTLTITIREV